MKASSIMSVSMSRRWQATMRLDASVEEGGVEEGASGSILGATSGGGGDEGGGGELEVRPI